jgi:hypothetical protein
MQEGRLDGMKYLDLEAINFRAVAAERLMIAVAHHPAMVLIGLENWK